MKRPPTVLPATVLLLLLAAACQQPASRPVAGDEFRSAPPSAAVLEDPESVVVVSVRVLDSPVAYRSASRAEADHRVEVVSAPKLVLHLHEQGSISISHEQAFVSRFVVERSAEAMIADPVVEVLQEGLILDIVAHTTPDGKWTGWLRLTESRLDSLEEASLQLAGAPVTVQLPEMRTWSTARVLEPSAEGRWLINLGRRDANWRLLDVAMAPGDTVRAAGVPRPGR